MKFLRVIAIFFSLLYCQSNYSVASDVANYKIVSNETGHRLLFTYYPFKRTDTYRDQEVVNYKLDSYDKLMKLNYRGTNLYFISWQYLDDAGVRQKFYYSDADELNTRTTYIIKPDGKIEFQG